MLSTLQAFAKPGFQESSKIAVINIISSPREVHKGPRCDRESYQKAGDDFLPGSKPGQEERRREACVPSRTRVASVATRGAQQGRPRVREAGPALRRSLVQVAAGAAGLGSRSQEAGHLPTLTSNARPLSRARPPTPSSSRTRPAPHPGRAWQRGRGRGRGRSRGRAVHYVGQGASAPRAAVAPGASACSRRRNGGRRLRRASYLHSPAVIFICGGNEVVSGAPSVAEPDIQIALPAPPAPARQSREPGAARARPASPLRPATARASSSSPAPLSRFPPFPPLLCPARLSPRNQPPCRVRLPGTPHAARNPTHSYSVRRLRKGCCSTVAALLRK
nr:zinc finger protein 469 [Macaca fascicularis]